MVKGGELKTEVLGASILAISGVSYADSSLRSRMDQRSERSLKRNVGATGFCLYTELKAGRARATRRPPVKVGPSHLTSALSDVRRPTSDVHQAPFRPDKIRRAPPSASFVSRSVITAQQASAPYLAIHTADIPIMASRAGPAAGRGMTTRFAQFKLVLLGESAVGKSSIVLRFVKDQFDSYRESTIGAAFLTQTISLDENTTVKFEIWDTAGQERYKSLAPMYYRNANCAVVVYDITQSASLDKAKAWVKELQRQANENIIIALAGNKLDLVNEQPDKRAVPTAEAEAYANEAGLLFFETSAKTAENVQELFTAIARKLPLDLVGPPAHSTWPTTGRRQPGTGRG
ncbi:hypothetical protein CHU98_g9460 [Xylaria longipes]|nr:hypothetical protein CHU98_g9460 [Xylaria longipes]